MLRFILSLVNRENKQIVRIPLSTFLDFADQTFEGDFHRAVFLWLVRRKPHHVTVICIYRNSALVLDA